MKAMVPLFLSLPEIRFTHFKMSNKNSLSMYTLMDEYTAECAIKMVY